MRSLILFRYAIIISFSHGIVNPFRRTDDRFAALREKNLRPADSRAEITYPSSVQCFFDTTIAAARAERAAITARPAMSEVCGAAD